MDKIRKLILFNIVAFCCLSVIASDPVYFHDVNTHLIYTLDKDTKEAVVGIEADFGWHDPTGLYKEDSEPFSVWNNIIVPESINYGSDTYMVVGIGRGAFNYTINVYSVELPKTIRYISDHAFNYCVNLQSIILQGEVSSIGTYAFGYCKNLECIHLPNNIVEIGYGAFSDCIKLQEINIPGKCKTIGEDAFKWCKALHKLVIEDGTEPLHLESTYGIGIDYFSSDPDGIDGLNHCRGMFADCPLDTLYLGRNLDYSVDKYFDYRVNYSQGPSYVHQLVRCSPFQKCSDYHYANRRYYYSGPNLKSLTFGNTVTKIPDYLFEEGIVKNKVSLPGQLDSIGICAFNKSTIDFRQLSLPSSVVCISDSAFYGCDIWDLELPSECDSIGIRSFFENNFRTLTIPQKVRAIGVQAFQSNFYLWEHNYDRLMCEMERTHLRKVEFLSTLPPVTTRDAFGDMPFFVPSGAGGVYRNKFGGVIVDSSDEIVTVNVKKAGSLYSRLLAQDIQANDVVKLKLKGTLNDDDVAVIKGMNNMYYIDLEEVVMDELPDNMFEGNILLNTIKLPSNLKSIRANEFKDCKYLSGNLLIPETCETIGDSAFFYTAIQNVLFPSSINIGDYAFLACLMLSEINIPEDAVVGRQAFYNCMEEKISGSTYRWTGQSSVKKVRVGTNAVVDERAFPTTLKETMLEPGVRIGSYALGDNLKQIAFEGMIDSIAVQEYSKLEKVYVSDINTWCNLPYKDAGPMENAPQLFIGDELVENLVIPNTVDNIRPYSFFNCSTLKNVTLPKSLKSICEYTFANCRNLQSVSIPSTILSIDSCAFQDCSSLVDIKLPPNIVKLGCSVFANCNSLENINIPQTLESIEDYTFKGCSSLHNVEYPNTIKSIGSYAFAECSSISEVDFPISITSIANSAYSECSGLKRVSAHWDEPIIIDESVFDYVSSDVFLYIPIGTAAAYYKAGWQGNIPNLKEAGILYFNNNIGGSITYNGESMGGKGRIFFAPYKSFVLLIEPDDGYQIKKVLLDGKDVTSELDENELFFDEPEDNMELSVVFCDPNIQMGDVNGDGIINVTDAIGVINYILKKPMSVFYDYVCDINNDNVVNVTDAVTIIRQAINTGSKVRNYTKYVSLDPQ